MFAIIVGVEQIFLFLKRFNAERTVKTMEKEKRRTLLFFSREAFVFILEKDAE